MSRIKHDRINRRFFLGSMAAGAAASAYFTVSGAFADELVRTPRQTEGPFYPDKLPLDTDNDLIVVNDNLTPAVGQITHLSGRILDQKGDPIRNALVEIWQVDNSGAYIHTKDPAHPRFDKNFQGYGKFLTASTGEYYFRTIKPVEYTGRCPHIHVKVRKNGKELLTTQFYIKGNPRNDRDGIFRAIRDKTARESVCLDFLPMPGSRIAELVARGDVVLGFTPPA
jgi:protocatechuate 3,4-dioxygenase, beta subunit